MYLDNTLNYISLKALLVDNLRNDRCIDISITLVYTKNINNK